MSEIITETTAPKKRMLSGIKPSGDLTLGSYLGAVKNWAERADQYECFYFMADLHTITVRQTGKYGVAARNPTFAIEREW